MMEEPIIKDIGTDCVECRRSTGLGSGRFVNRVPATTDSLDGYMCGECVGDNTDIEQGD